MSTRGLLCTSMCANSTESLFICEIMRSFKLNKTYFEKAEIIYLVWLSRKVQSSLAINNSRHVIKRGKYFVVLCKDWLFFLCFLHHKTFCWQNKRRDRLILFYRKVVKLIINYFGNKITKLSDFCQEKKSYKFWTFLNIFGFWQIKTICRRYLGLWETLLNTF